MISRVHWLLFHLSPGFKAKYKLIFDYKFHSYCFYRPVYGHTSIKFIDLFVVVRTSKRCFRLMYVNRTTAWVTYESFKTSQACATYMERMADSVNNSTQV